MDEAALADRLVVPVTVLDSTPDTSARLRRRAREGAPHGTFAVANELTAARGRTGSAWAAPPGGVWSSTLLYPDLDPERAGRLTIAGGLATVEMARSFGVDAWLKWPNDVVVDRDRADAIASERSDAPAVERSDATGAPTPDRRPKLAGVLTEAVVDAVPIAGKPVDEALDEPGDLECVILGVGVNADLAPGDLETDRPVATMREETGGPVDRTEVAAALHERLLDRAAQVETDDGFAAALDDWRALTVTLGERVRVERRGDAEPLVGRAIDVDERGALVVETDGGTEAVSEGNCERVRPAQAGANAD